MADPAIGLTIRYLLLTSTMVVTAKVAFIMLQRYRRFAEKLTYRRKKPILTKLYKDINAYKISTQTRQELELKDDEFIYGEIMFSSFAEILLKAQPQPGEIFYDLGCGSGKAVFISGLLYDYLDVRGVEFLKPLYNLCNDLVPTFHTLLKNKHPKNISFIHADLLEHDFSDADIIFLNATCFKKMTWRAIIEKLNALKKGSRVIITSKPLESDHFEQTHTGTYLMSWGQNTIRIYRKKW